MLQVDLGAILQGIRGGEGSWFCDGLALLG